MIYSLRTAASLSYIIISLVIIITITVFSNIILNKEFEDYVKKQQEIKEEEIVHLISNSYNKNIDTWGSTTLNNVGTHGLEYGLIMKLKNIQNDYLWDATSYNNGEYVEIITNIQENIRKKYRNFNDSYIENEYIIEYENEIVGYLYIGYYGPFFLSNNDLNFIITLNIMLILITVFSIILALILGISMSRRVSDPVLQVINTTKEIEKGNYKSKIIDKKFIAREMKEMVNTINNLASVLENQENLRNRLTSDVAHELRTPLAILQSHIEAMIDGVWEPSVDVLESCNNELKRITNIVGDLEKLAEIEDDNIILNKTKFNIDKLMKDILKIFKFEFENKNISLTIKYDANEIYADKDKIKQVIVNILSNALKYNQDGGTIEISTQKIQDKTIIRINDSGIGISSEDLPYIFNRFYRVDKSRNRSTGGSGIGLSITRAIIDAHGGEIEVNSILGSGSEFVIMIPFKSEMAQS